MYGHPSQDQGSANQSSFTGPSSGPSSGSTFSYIPSIEDDFDDSSNFNTTSFQSQSSTSFWPDFSADAPPGSHSSSSEVKPTLQPHRNACAICRKRKLKCDGAAPYCGRCERLGHECVYVESRRKSGPKRGYVKGLESRLAQVEGLLKEKESTAPSSASASTTGLGSGNPDFSSRETLQGSFPQPVEYEDVYLRNSAFLPDLASNVHFQSPPLNLNQAYASEGSEEKLKYETINEGSSWALSELGVEEPLPPTETVNELTRIYFEKIHPSNDMIHQYRFFAALSLSSSARPSIALRYAMWTLAAGISPTYKHLSPLFYLRTRKYAEADEAGSRTKYVNIRHAQTWILIGTYEYKMLMFPKSWLSIGKAVRLCQMLGLHRLDGRGLGHRQALEAPGDLTEKEERRRTFWMAFGMDRYAAASTGWPVIVDERDILTYLPSSESAFENGDEEPGTFLQDAMQPMQAATLSSFAGVIVVSSLIGRIFEHLSRQNPLDLDSDPNSDFWRSHRKIENVLLNMVLHLPSHLRLPTGSTNSNTVFLNMTLQSATICLHQAAMAKAEKVPAGLGYESVVEESKARCAAAAHEIASIMKRIAHFDLSTLHPYIPFPLYLSARIFAQMAKSNPEDDNANSLVRFLLSALVAMKEVNPLVESYLAQLDMEDLGLSALRENVRMFGLERGVSGISLSESEEAKPWISYVSPMVRIVEVSEDSMSPPASRPRHSSTPSTSDLNLNTNINTKSSPSPNPSLSPYPASNQKGKSPASASTPSISGVSVSRSGSGSGSFLGPGRETGIYSNLNEHEMNFDIPTNAVDGFEGMETINMGEFPGPGAWDLDGANMRTEHYDPSGGFGG